MKLFRKMIKLLVCSALLFFVLVPSVYANQRIYPPLKVNVTLEVRADNGVEIPDSITYRVKRSVELVNYAAYYRYYNYNYTDDDIALTPFHVADLNDRGTWKTGKPLEEHQLKWSGGSRWLSTSFVKTRSRGIGVSFGAGGSYGTQYGANGRNEDLLWFIPDAATSPQLSVVGIEDISWSPNISKAELFNYADGRGGVSSVPAPNCIRLVHANSNSSGKETATISCKLILKYNPTISEKKQPEPPETKRTKTLTALGKNEYRLDLTMDSLPLDAEEKDKSIILVVDTSGSMDDKMNGADTTIEEEKRITMLRKRLKELVEQLGRNPHYHISLVQFSGTASIKSTNVLPYDAAQREDLKRKIDSLTAKGGTNYYDAIEKLKEAMSATTGDEKIVFFVTDGEPTAAVSGAKIATGVEERSDVATLFALYATENLIVDRFYSIYIGAGKGGSALQSVTQRVQLTGRNKDSEKYMVQATSDTEFQTAMDRFIAFIDNSWDNLTIEDELSEYLDFAGNDAIVTAVTTDINGNVTERTLVRGRTEDENDYTLVRSGKKITMRLNQPTTLGTTYKLSFKVKANSAAMSYFYNHMDSDGDGIIDNPEDIYTFVGDPETGDFSGQPGFRSNKKATVTYWTAGSQVEPKEYPHPVFQVEPDLKNMEIHFTKQLSGKALREGMFEFQLYDKDGNPLGDPVTNAADGEIVFNDLKIIRPGTYSFSAREIIPAVPAPGFTYDESEKRVELTVSYNEQTNQLEGNVNYLTDSIFRNEYHPEPVSVTLEAEKILNGALELESGMFTFILRGPEGVIERVDNGYEGDPARIVFSPFEISAVGTYEYTITESLDLSGEKQSIFPLLANVDYDFTPVKVVVNVVDNEEEAKLEAQVSYSKNGQEDNNTFTNKYTVPPLDAEIEIPVILTGRRLTQGLFRYNLYMYDEEEGEQGMPVLEDVGNSADGKVRFNLETRYDEETGRIGFRLPERTGIEETGEDPDDPDDPDEDDEDDEDEDGWVWVSAPVNFTFLATQITPEDPMPFMDYDKDKRIVVHLKIKLENGLLRAETELKVKDDPDAAAEFFNIYNIRGGIW